VKNEANCSSNEKLSKPEP